MPITLVYNLTEFYKELYLPSAYIVALDSQNELSFIQKRNVNISILKDYPRLLTPVARQLLDIIQRISPKELEKKYNAADTKRITPLSKLLEERLISEKIEAYIDRNLAHFLELVFENNLPICLNIDSKPVAHFTEIEVSNKILTPKIFFELKPDGSLLYQMELIENGRIVKVHEKHCIPICNEPAWIIWGDELLRVESIKSARLKPFFNKTEVIIPKKNLIEYYKKVISPLVEKLDFEYKGFEIERYSQILKTELSIMHDFTTNSYGLNLAFDYGRFIFKWKDSDSQRTFLKIEDNDEPLIQHVKRDFEAEKKYIQVLLDWGLSNLHSNYFEIESLPSSSMEELIHWLAEHLKALKQAGFSIKNPSIDDKTLIIARPHLGAVVAENENDWFDLKGSITIAHFVIPFGRLIPYIRKNNPYFELPDGTYFIIPNEWFQKFQGVAQMGKAHGEGVRLVKSQALILLPEEYLENVQQAPKNLEWTPPQYLKADLRPYQVDGVLWLLKHYHSGLGACLADDMGLGKTLQTIAALLYVKENKKAQPVLSPNLDLFHQDDLHSPLQAIIVLPASLAFNWESEWRKFAPNIFVYIHIGPKRHKDTRLIMRYDIVITTYQTLTKDIDLLEKIDWEYIILDESQYIKNKSSDTFKAVKRLKSAHKISLSGTPIENSLADLWAQMDFINTGLLGNFSYFDQYFIKPIEKSNDEDPKERLRELVKPYLLRRTKEEVAKDLPDILRQIVFSDMSSEQRKIYEKEKSAIRNLLLGGESVNKTQFEYRNILIQSITRLRQLAIHPQLVFEDYKGENAKFNDVIAKWNEVRLANHKMLIFSTFVENLKFYRQYLDSEKQPYAWLTGSDSIKKRQEEISGFSRDTSIQTFLISLKAGGAGLNLTAADYVFILDPWWNPAAEEQAIARAHRIGQTRNVVALKFITRDTIEEKIIKLQERKKQLVTDILDFETTPQFTRDDIAFLLE